MYKLSSTTILSFLVLAHAACMTSSRGKRLENELQILTARNKELTNEILNQRTLTENTNRVVTRNTADAGSRVDLVQKDVGVLTGKVDDLQHSVEALTKQFQDFRAASDTKLETLSNVMTAAKTPPLPETADQVYGEGERRLGNREWADARRLFEAFVNRYPQDARAARAQFQIGKAYEGEKRLANAIGAYTKVVDNFPKSDVVPDAMYYNGLAFYGLKYCGDAKIYFQELLRRYPKTTWKNQANSELKKLAHDAKNRAACNP